MKRLLVIVASLCIAACAQAGGPPTASPSSNPDTPKALPAPVKALADQGLEIDGSLDAPTGFRGYLGKLRGQPLPVYLLPDGKHVVIGSLYDANGRDLTTPVMSEATAPVLGDAQWKQLENATWIAEGSAKPERIVYEFTDTECPFCHKLWQAQQPLLESGKVQVRHIVVAVISPKSLPRGAAVLDAADPSAALRRHENAFGHSPYPADGNPPVNVRNKIAANNQLMQELGIAGTPGIVYKDDQGKIRMAVGMPDPQTLKAIYGG